MFEIIPSPGTDNKDWSQVASKIDMVKPLAKTVHIDVLDGKFAPNTTFLDPKTFEKYGKDLILEAHLMVEEPIHYLKSFADAGFRRFIGQVEKMSDQAEYVAQAELLGEVSLALDSDTPLDAIKVSLEDLDSVLVMTVKAGFSGQKFMEQPLEKVKQILEKLPTLPVELDGGINDETIEVGAACGATRFVATSFLFGVGTAESQYKLLLEKLEKLKVV
jgi:ribulose-phosphate 3-epimerase